MINIMVADDLIAPRARASAAIDVNLVLPEYSDLRSVPDGLKWMSVTLKSAGHQHGCLISSNLSVAIHKTLHRKLVILPLYIPCESVITLNFLSQIDPP